MSVPVKPQSPHHQRRHPAVEPALPTDVPFWHNPCGAQLTYDGSGGGAGAGSGVGHDMMMESESMMRREEEIIDGVVLSANQALMHAEQFAGSFVSATHHFSVFLNQPLPPSSSRAVPKFPRSV